MAVKKLKLPDNSTQDIHDARITGVDSSPTSNSGNVVTSGGVYTAIQNADDVYIYDLGGADIDLWTSSNPGQLASGTYNTLATAIRSGKIVVLKNVPQGESATYHYFAYDGSFDNDSLTFTYVDDVGALYVLFINPNDYIWQDCIRLQPTIRTIKVNGTALTPDANKAVDVKVPTIVWSEEVDSAFDPTTLSFSTSFYNYIRTKVRDGYVPIIRLWDEDGYYLDYLFNYITDDGNELEFINTSTGDIRSILITYNGTTTSTTLDTKDLYGLESSSNKVTSISSSSTNTQYPSAKLLYDQLALKADKSATVSFDNTNYITKYDGSSGFAGIVSWDGAYYALPGMDDGSEDGILAQLTSPAFTGTPTAPTATTGTNTSQIATTAFVQTAVTAGINSKSIRLYSYSAQGRDFSDLTGQDIETISDDIINSFIDSDITPVIHINYDDGVNTYDEYYYYVCRFNTQYYFLGNGSGKLLTLYEDDLDGATLTTIFQPKLVSGTNIKTINNESILGSGNISISGGGGGGATITFRQW